MQIAIVHYHLNRGGVTQVISNHLRSLDVVLPGTQKMRVALLHGGREDGWNAEALDELQHLEVSSHAVDGLDYDQWPEDRPDPIGLADNLHRVLNEIAFDAADTVIHVHNHALGKNVSLPGALTRLAELGYPLLLQIHDFAEDFRSDLYARLSAALADEMPEALPNTLYPQTDRIHYAALNGRDHRVLAGAGVPANRLHDLPNPVVEFGTLPDHDRAHAAVTAQLGVSAQRRLIVYPVRGIGRKNIGELLLWSALAGDHAVFGSTLAPMNPAERTSYELWKSLAASARLPCFFELGDHFSFLENLAAADALISTSVAEGFGMVFLETWLAGRNLVGRRLPEITSDFQQNGLDLSASYDQLAIPLNWIGRERLQQAFLASYHNTIADYGRRTDAAVDDQQMFSELVSDSLTDEATVDFAILTPDLQADVVLRLATSESDRALLLEYNPIVARALQFSTAERVISSNAEVVRDHYSPESCGRRLCGIYEALLASDRSAAIVGPERGERILESFLDIRRYRPLRSTA